jgi:hypothetical protein
VARGPAPRLRPKHVSASGLSHKHKRIAQLGAAPDFEPLVAASRVRYHSACGTKPVSFKPLGNTLMRILATATLGLFLAACISAPHRVEGDIRVYVYYAENTQPQPAAGATVFLLGAENRVIATATADREGVATFPASYDSSRTKYFLAELNPLLLTGVRWSAGRREYNLPLRVEPLVNRAIVKAP